MKHKLCHLMLYKEYKKIEEARITELSASKIKRSMEQPIFCQYIYYPEDQH